MSTLYIRLPSSAATDSNLRPAELGCLFALAGDNGTIEREGNSSLAGLASAMVRAQRVVLLLAASDVSLLHVKAPPLSPARLRAALPHLVEDQLIADPSECVIVGGGLSDGLRTVAVVQRAWLETLVKTVVAQGARRIAALPSQLCLPYQPHTVSAAVADQGTDIDLTIRLSHESGMGLPVMPETSETAAHDVMQILRTMAGNGPVNLHVPQASLAAYQEAADQQMKVLPDQWSRWIAGAATVPLDLTAGLSAGSRPAFNWGRWRWPMILGLAVSVINIVALNSDWLRMRSEANDLQASIMRTYRTTFPRDTVIVDPMAQMRQKIAAAKRTAGQPAPDDFAALAARFGGVWRSMPPNAASAIAGLDYRDRVLTVKLKSSGSALFSSMKNGLTPYNISLSETAPDTWQVRSGGVK